MSEDVRTVLKGLTPRAVGGEPRRGGWSHRWDTAGTGKL